MQGRHALWGRLEIGTTQHPGHARELAEQAVRRGVEVVLAVGGDGTVNEVAGGLLGSETALGIVPVGSGNGLARTLGLPLAPERAIAALERALVRRMDVGMVNGRPFLNVAGAGFDAAIGAEFHRHGRDGGRRGILPYVRLSLAHGRRYEPALFRLQAGGEDWSGRALLVAFVNGRQYGAGAVIAPRARLDDGQLDVVRFEAAPWAEVLLNAPRAFLGGIEGFRRYHRVLAAQATLEAEGLFPHHRDGEPEADLARLDVRLEPRALRILVPAAVAEDPEGPFLPQNERGA